MLTSLILLLSNYLQAAIPTNPADCLVGQGVYRSVNDLKEIAKSTPVVVCENNITNMGKANIKELLKSDMVQVGISVARSEYTKEDLMELASQGPFLLYVDSPKFFRDNLLDIVRAGADIMVFSAEAGLYPTDFEALAKQKKYTLYVNSPITKPELKKLLAMGVRLNLSNNQSGLSTSDVVELVKENPGQVSLKP